MHCMNNEYHSAETAVPAAAAVSAASAAAIALCRRLSADEQNILGNLLTLTGTAILSIAAMNAAADESAQTGAKGGAQSQARRKSPP